MEWDLLFPAVVGLALFRSLLLVQVSDREKQIAYCSEELPGCIAYQIKV